MARFTMSVECGGLLPLFVDAVGAPVPQFIT